MWQNIEGGGASLIMNDRKFLFAQYHGHEYIKEIMGMKVKPDTTDITEQKRLQRCGHVKMMPGERIPKLIVAWIPREERKRGRSKKKTWMERVQAAMTTRNLEPDLNKYFM